MQPSDADLILRPMPEAQIADWMVRNRTSYIDSRVASGDSVEQARATADRQFGEYFPDGRPADGHLLFVIERTVGGEADQVGVLWLGPHPQRIDDHQQAWVYEIEIDEAHRGQGLGRATLAAAEQVLRERGVTRLSLNVFGPNTVARNLYHSVGFEEVARIMSKQI